MSPLKELFLKALLMLLVVGSHSLMTGQTKESKNLSLKTDPQIAATNESLVALVASIKNSSSENFIGILKVETDSPLKQINQGTISLDIPAGESAFLPIKFWVGKQQPSGQNKLVFNLYDAQNKLVQSSTTTLEIAPKRQLRILGEDSQILMRRVGDSIRIPIRVYNNGNQKERIRLIATFPQVAIQHGSLTKEIELKPFTDTLVQFSKIIDRELMDLEFFTVNVAALDYNNDFVGNSITTIQNASGDRRYINPSNNGFPNNYWNDNKVTWSAQDLSGTNPSYSITGKNEIQINQSRLAVSVDGTRWSHSSASPLFTNTWLQFETGNKGIQLGNIQENDLEINLSGRGVKGYTTTDERVRKMEFGFLEKSYNLIGPTAWNSQGIAAFAKNKFELSDKTNLNSSVIFDRNYGIDSYILMNHLLWNPNSNWKYDFKFAQGLTGASSQNRQLAYKPSIALGANLQAKAGAFYINSTNFYSSAYYPGIRKGALLLDERVSRSFAKHSLWFGINYYNFNPDFIDPLMNFKNDSESFRAEIGANLFLSPRFRLSIVPQLNFENGKYLVLNTASYQNLNYRAISINETFNLTSKNHLHNVFLSLDQGFAQYPFSTVNEFIHKTQISWGFQGFQMSAFFQQGNFMLVEGLYNSFNSEEKLTRISIMPSYRKTFLSDRLSIQVNGMYNYDNFSGKSYMLSGTTEWKAFKKTSLFLSVNQYQYENTSFQTQNTFIQAGITQLLPNSPLTTNIKKGTLRIYCYYDYNTNGVFDEGDKLAADRVVLINGSAFVTQKDGTVKYRSVPYGAYHISVKGKNWMAKEYDENLVSKSLELGIPLQETGNLKGKFEYIYNSKLQYEVTGNRAGLMVLLKNAQGESRSFKTNDLGEFIAYLPIGNYELTVDPAQLPKNVYTEEPARMITIKKGVSQTLEPLILKVRERKIEIKRFGN